MTFIHNLAGTCSVVLPAGTRKQLSVTPDIFDLLKKSQRCDVWPQFFSHLGCFYAVGTAETDWNILLKVYSDCKGELIGGC